MTKVTKRPGKKPARNALAEIQMQVMWNRLISVVEEQAQTLIRTAFGEIGRAHV